MAVEETIGRRLKKGELEQMMQKKQLDPEKILPLVGKYFMQLANKGGALTDKMKQLEAIQGRMNQSWTFWINSIYRGGLEDALIDLYKMLDKIFWFLEQGGTSAIGSFLKGFIGQLKETIQFVYDLGMVLSYVFERYFGANMDMEWLGKAAYWILLVNTLSLISKFMGLIFGGKMIKNVYEMTKALTGFGAAATVAGGGAATGGAGKMGLMTKVFIAGIAMSVLTDIVRAAFGIDSTEDIMARNTPQGGEVIKEMSGVNSMPEWLNAIGNFFTFGTGEDFVMTAAERRLNKLDNIENLAPKSALYQQQYAELQRMKDTPIKLEVKVKDSEFAKAIDLRVKDGFGKVMNSLLPASTKQAPSLLVR